MRKIWRRYSGVWESVVSSPSGVRGGAQTENGFIVIKSLQIVSVDSILKSGWYGPKSESTSTPRTPVNYGCDDLQLIGQL